MATNTKPVSVTAPVPTSRKKFVHCPGKENIGSNHRLIVTMCKTMLVVPPADEMRHERVSRIQ